MQARQAADLLVPSPRVNAPPANHLDHPPELRASALQRYVSDQPYNTTVPDDIIELHIDSTPRGDPGEKPQVHAQPHNVAGAFRYNPASFEVYAFQLDPAIGRARAQALDDL